MNRNPHLGASSKLASTKHGRVFESIRNRIRSGELRPGAQVPTESLLVEEFGVSRPTVAKALQELQRQGLVRRRQGSGTFVLASTVESRQFGLLIPGLGDTEVFGPICGEIARMAQLGGHSLWWGAADGSTESDRHEPSNKGAIAWDLCQRYINEAVSGVFFAPLSLTLDHDQVNRRIVDALAVAKIPLVLIDRDFVSYPGRSAYDLVGINNRRAGHTITDHLFERGCKNLHFVLRPGSASTIKARAAGFMEAFFTHGVDFERHRVHSCDPRDKNYVGSMLAKYHPDGIACGNDVTAGYLMHTLEELGVDVPREVKVGGVDDVKFAELLRVRLTTVRQPCAAIGQAAYHVMLDRIAHPDWAPRHIMLGCDLVVRDSTQEPGQLARGAAAQAGYRA